LVIGITRALLQSSNFIQAKQRRRSSHRSSLIAITICSGA